MTATNEMDVTGGVRRDASGRVVSGVLNPTGRPKGDGWFRELCRERTHQALQALTDALDDPDTRVSAAKALLEFAWGKAPPAGYEPAVDAKPGAQTDALAGMTPEQRQQLAASYLASRKSH